MKLRISITKNILNRAAFCGYSNHVGDVATNCAIALAVRDIWPDAYVGKRSIVLPGSSVDISLPLEAAMFIKTFDSFRSYERTEMDEFSFEIEIPQEIIDMINIDEIKALLVNHHCLELV